MSSIKTFSFDTNGFDEIKKYHFGRNWPVVYVLENANEMYIGESTSAYYRCKQHFENPVRKRLKHAHVITDDEYNKSAILDIESWLIQYMAAEGTVVLQNGNKGLRNHNYYQKEKYEAKFEVIWEELIRMSLVKKTLLEIRNSDLFKFSPYKALNDEQFLFVKKLFKDIAAGTASTYIVQGSAGTGKTVLASFLIKYLRDQKETAHLRVGLVIGMSSLRRTMQKVFAQTPGLKANMVLGPNDVVKEKYDILIVDEAHRLKRRKNLGAAFKAFDDVNRKLGFSKESNQLDWILKSSKQQIFFYDHAQRVMPADIDPEVFAELPAQRYVLATQMRVQAGAEYIEAIHNILSNGSVKGVSVQDYDFRIINDFETLHTLVKEKDAEYGLGRIVAGYAWPWVSNPDRNKNPAAYDIELDNYRMKWNSVAQDWVNSPNAINEVGCIHTIQGYGLNYVGVGIGPEVKFNPETKQLEIDSDHYYDKNGYTGIDENELRYCILNIYKTLLTRGISGTYVYIVDAHLRNRFKDVFGENTVVKKGGPILSPLKVSTVRVPFVGSAPCGNPLFGEENREGYIEVDKTKIKPGFKYFVLRAEGDSMNKAGILDGDLVLCRQQLKADTGDKVVALLGDNVTIKEYGPRENGVRLLLPRSTNKTHQAITPEEGATVQGIVQEVLVKE
jgi:DUF2075 family protein/DNA replication protein DnaC